MKIPGLFFYTFFCGIENSSIVFISFNLCLYPINVNMAEQNMPAFNPIPGGQFDPPTTVFFTLLKKYWSQAVEIF